MLPTRALGGAVAWGVISALCGARIALAATTNVEFVLDVSGSMQHKINEETQIESARKALLGALDQLPSDELVAVRVYGHRVDQRNKSESCKDTELLVPFKKSDKDEISGKIGGLTPRGWTPIAFALQETRNDLYDVSMAKEAERAIILLTDGEETCGGDPVKVLKDLEKEGFKVTVYTIGFNVNDIGRKQLKEIAAVSGGKYFEAKDAPQLVTALSDAAKASTTVVVKKEAKVYGTEIHGGNSYEDAVPLPLNQELRLDHHQKKDNYDYFYVDLKRGSQLQMTMTTGDKGVSIDDHGKVTIESNPYAGMQVHDSRRNQVKHEDIIGDAFKTKDFRYGVPTDGRYYVLVGSNYAAMNKDGFTFKGTLEQKGDLGGPTDAGSTLETALPITPQRYPVNYIGDADDTDMFSFKAKAGESYLVGIVPNENYDGYFSIQVLDDFKEVVMSENSTSGAGIKSKPFEIKEDGTYYLEVTLKRDQLVSYALILKRTQSVGEGGEEGAAAPAAPPAAAPAEAAPPAAPAEAAPAPNAEEGGAQ